jgi:hypothetical protein
MPINWVTLAAACANTSARWPRTVHESSVWPAAPHRLYLILIN